MAETLMVTAVLIGLIGLALSSPSGVGFACLLGIAARMIQAANHTRELRHTTTDDRPRQPA